MDPEMIPVHMTRDVFVAGGTPGATYNPRQGQRIERTVEQYLAETGKALTIHGPSKSGKTSLVERLLPADRAIWLQGQDIGTIDAFWGQLGTQLGIGRTKTDSSSQEATVATTYGVGAGVPKVAHADWSRADGEKSGTSTSQTGDIHVPDAVRAKLSATRRPIVIDDFHFIDDSIKKGISRAVKTIVRTSPLVLIAVPSEAFELVRTEPEMGLRVWSLPIPAWEDEELAQIAADGFPLLNLIDVGGGVARTLARRSYGSPFIMQQLCHDLVRWEFDIAETPRERVTLGLPVDMERFLGESANRTPPPLFSRLLAGPATKGTDRIEIILKDGVRTDIYGAVLTAIRNLVPPMEHLERAVNQEVQKITTSSVSGTRVNNAVRQINKIAYEHRGVSDPVLRVRDDKLFIQDAMLAFYLNHGDWTPAKYGNSIAPGLDPGGSDQAIPEDLDDGR